MLPNIESPPASSASEQDLRPRARTLSWMASLSVAAGEIRAAEGYLLELLAWCAFADRDGGTEATIDDDELWTAAAVREHLRAGRELGGSARAAEQLVCDASAAAMPVVTIIGEAGPVTVECADGDSLFDAGAKVLAGIDTACVGKGTCGLCRVKILAGAEHLNGFTDEERKHLGNVYHLTKVRLACRAKVSGGDVTLQVVRKKR